MKEQTKKVKRDPVLLNFTNLAQTLSKMESKNLSKLSQIQSINPLFTFRLHRPAIPSYGSREQLSLGQEIMMQQIDKLLMDQQKLNIELDRLQIKGKEQQKVQQKELMLSVDHFTFLRKLWKKVNINFSLEEQTDQLIHNVGSIKGHILNLTKKQNSLSQSPPQIHQLILSSPEYNSLLKKYVQLQSKLTNQKLEQVTDSLTGIQQMRKYNEELEQELAKIKIQMANKDLQIQRILAKEKTWNVFKDDKEKISTIYSVLSSDGQYRMLIHEFEKKQSPKNVENNEPLIKKLISKINLETLIKSLSLGQPRKSIKNVEPSEQYLKQRKFTVQDFARPKFISNRNMSRQKPISDQI